MHYVEGCTAPIYKSDSLHSAVGRSSSKPKVAGAGTPTIQNWSNNVYNLVTKRARAEAGATMEWIGGNIGSQGHHEVSGGVDDGRARPGEVLSVAFAGEGQHQDTGAKMLHLAPNVEQHRVKSVASGTADGPPYRGLVQVNKGGPRIAFQREMRCAAGRYDQPQRHLSIRRHPRGTT